MKIHTFRPEDGTFAGCENGGRGFQEVERLFGADIIELLDVVALGAISWRFCVNIE